MHLYFKIYKPFEVLSQFSAQEGKRTLADFFSVPKDVYPIGRLDYDSEGLLLLSNDKKLNHRLLHPTFLHQRVYWAQVDGCITPDAIAALSNGVDINVDGKMHRTKKAIVSLFDTDPLVPPRNPPIRFRKEIPAPWIQLKLTEGKNRQVRKMTAKVGFPTLRLIRNSIEGIQLGNMQPGDIVSMSQQEVYQQLFQNAP